METTAFLESIINAVKGKPLTAERLLISVVNILTRGQFDNLTETENVLKLIGHYHLDSEDAMAIYEKHIDLYKDNPTADEMYLQKMRYDACECAKQYNLEKLSADVLIMCILVNPFGGVGEYLELCKKLPVTFDALEDLLGYIRPEKMHRVKNDMVNLVADIKGIRKKLKSAVFGQDNAIDVFLTGYFQSVMLSAIDNSRKTPCASFLFAGPSGVGKTFLAEKIAEALKLPFMRFDMSEYSDKDSAIEFCGADKVYNNAKSGNVTGFVYNNPKSVLLFDEIEKAHSSIIHLFLQILDGGRLRDNNTDIEVSFTDTIIIFTTNAGRQLYEESEFGDFSSLPRKVVINSLKKDVNPETGAPYFPDAMCSRFALGNVVMFNHMDAYTLRRIVKKRLLKHATNFETKTGMQVCVDDKVYSALLFLEGGNADARTVTGRAEAFFNTELYELFRLIATNKVKTDIDNVDKIHISVDLSHAKPEIKALFEPEKQTDILVFADEETVAMCQKCNPEFTVHGADTLEKAIGIMKTNNIYFVLLDMECGAPTHLLESLNIEDVNSPARDFFKFMRDNRNALPMFLLEKNEFSLTEEEKVSFIRQGVRGVLSLDDTDNISTIASGLYQQSGMVKLARENKVVSFETSQSVSEDGKAAYIKLFDFDMVVAIDSGDAKNLLSVMSRPDVSFDDVIGADAAKQELKYFVDYLKDPDKYVGTGVKAPRGLLLYGPSGTGKTMLAKAMAGESGVTFIVAEGNQFLKKYVGEGPEKVHELFKIARKYAPSILFVDEIDAIAMSRDDCSDLGGTKATLTAFLTEMDGFKNDPSKPVFVLAATNCKVSRGFDNSLDDSLLRRFDRRVCIELPAKADRVKFLKLRKENTPTLQIDDSVIENIAVRSTGMSLAELDSVIELALRLAIRAESTSVTNAIFEDAFETFNNGEIKKWDPTQFMRVARHEAGHAFICFDSGKTPSYLTVVSRGDHGGYMQYADNEDKAVYTKNELLSKIRIALGGRAAEIVYYGDTDGLSTSASGDLAAATNLARSIVCDYGMDARFGLSVLSDFDEKMTLTVRDTVNKILENELDAAVNIIRKNTAKIDLLVNELIDKNHLNSDEINDILK